MMSNSIKKLISSITRLNADIKKKKKKKNSKEVLCENDEYDET